MIDLWLIRHGQTDWNLTGRWQGQADYAPGLNTTGFAQTKAIYDQLPHLRFSAIYSSDLLRARQTAETIAALLGLSVTLEPCLREINLGVWEGMLSEDVQRQYLHELNERQRNPLHHRAPGGESVLEVVGRVRKAMNEITTTNLDQSVLIVSHGVTLAVIICLAQGIPLTDVYKHIPDNGHLYHIGRVNALDYGNNGSK